MAPSDVGGASDECLPLGNYSGSPPTREFRSWWRQIGHDDGSGYSLHFDVVTRYFFLLHLLQRELGPAESTLHVVPT